MGLEYMQVRPEVWPLAADRMGIWLLSGAQQWKPLGPVYSDGSVHADVEGILTTNGVDIDPELLLVLHSPSWRSDGYAVILSYVAVVAVQGDFVRSQWPGAEPVSPLLPAAVGQPLKHGPVDPPIVRDVDVLLHALRHLAFLRLYDSTSAAVLERNRYWSAALDTLQPALAGLYQHEDRRAA